MWISLRRQSCIASCALRHRAQLAKGPLRRLRNSSASVINRLLFIALDHHNMNKHFSKGRTFLFGNLRQRNCFKHPTSFLASAISWQEALWCYGHRQPRGRVSASRLWPRPTGSSWDSSSCTMPSKVHAEGPGLKPSSPLQSIYFFLCPVVPTRPSFPDIRKEGCRRRPSSGEVASSSKGAVLRGLTLERRGNLTKVRASCELMLLEEDSLKVRWASERLPRGSLATFWRKCPLQRSASSPKEEKREAGRQACCDEGANS